MRYMALTHEKLLAERLEFLLLLFSLEIDYGRWAIVYFAKLVQSDRPCSEGQASEVGVV